MRDFVISDPQKIRSWAGQTISIVPRQKCRFARYRLRSSGRQAMAAAKLKAKRELLVFDGGVHFQVGGEGEYLSAWSFPWVGAPFSRHLPESLACEPIQNGARILACSVGFEGQVWRSGVVIASRWWPVVPSTLEWRIFTDTVDFSKEKGANFEFPPEAMRLPYREDLPGLRIDILRVNQIFSPIRVAIGLGFIFLSSSGWLIGETSKVNVQKHEITTLLSEKSSENQLVVAKRRQALAIAREVTGIARPLRSDGFLHSLNAVQQGLSSYSPYELQAFSLDGDRMEVRVKVRGVGNIPALVKRLENLAALQDVNVSANDRLELTIRVRLEAILKGDEGVSSEGAGL